jgi:hypothetical protein
MKYTDLNKHQYQIASLLAYECLYKHNNPGKVLNNDRLNVARHACSLVGITDEMILKIISGKITKLQNLNKLSSFHVYENDYTFNIY